MFAAGSPSIEWYVDAEDDACGLLPLIAANDNSVIAMAVTFDGGELLSAACEQLPYAMDFTLPEPHVELPFTEIVGEKQSPGASKDGRTKDVALCQNTSSAAIKPASVCDVCYLRFKCRTQLTRHQLLHHEHELVVSEASIRCGNQCCQCGEHFTSVKQLENHLTTQHPQCVLCDLCLTTFQTQTSLARHRNYHLSKELLLSHKRATTFSCDVCQKQCATSSHLNFHRKIHLEQKPYPCTFGCGRSFSSSGNRQKHFARMHTHERKYSCGTCSESFIYARQLKLHRQRKHADFKPNLICPRCSEQFEAEDILQQHVKKGQCMEYRGFECLLCTRRFKQSTHLQNHVLTHAEGVRAFGCEFCSKRFTLAGDLRVHRRIHTKEKPFRCDLCPAAFIMGKQLNKHRSAVHSS
uniref:C2H2-type domain-containing protein n=1 Tax=Anopheles dirus TaxID=7168 RepID=A0A182NWX9_9DIPT